MSERVHNWYRRAVRLATTLRSSAREYAYIASKYEKMRNINPSPSNSNKTRVDNAYSELYDARNELCSVQAGGRRQTRRRR